jgi:hypothetical protein
VKKLNPGDDIAEDNTGFWNREQEHKPEISE